jgi:hypothetical protein
VSNLESFDISISVEKARQADRVLRIDIPFERNFTEFQDLDPAIRAAIVVATQINQKIGKVKSDSADTAAVQYLADLYFPQGQYAIGQMVERYEFLSRDPMCQSMVRCFIDNGYNLLQAKLAWSEEY